MTADPARTAARARGAAYADLLRPYTARLPLLPFLVVGAGAGQPARHLAGGVLLIFCAYGLAAAYNDLHDIEVDRANGRRRPLATGALSPADAGKAMVACALGVAVSQLLLVQPLGLAVTIASVAATAAYSHPRLGLERRGVLGTATLAVTYLVLPVLLAGGTVAPLGLAALVAGGTATLLYKDVKDEHGDRLLGKRTPLVRWGRRRMDTTAALLGAAALVLGLAAAGPGWWTVAAVAGMATQLVVAATAAGDGRWLTVQRLVAVLGLVLLAAA